MSFTLRELLGADVPKVEPVKSDDPERVCATGKTCFASKAEAERALQRVNAQQNAPMRKFRCDYCAQFHLGHRRGTDRAR